MVQERGQEEAITKAGGHHTRNNSMPMTATSKFVTTKMNHHLHRHHHRHQKRFLYAWASITFLVSMMYLMAPDLSASIFDSTQGSESGTFLPPHVLNKKKQEPPQDHSHSKESAAFSNTTTFEASANVQAAATLQGATPTVTSTSTLVTATTSTRISPACRPTLPDRPITRIVFGHMRKAGGTTISNYLYKTLKEQFPLLEVLLFEGGMIETPGSRNDTLYVTHIRNPTQRVITHYKYSGRWKCDYLVNTKDNRPHPHGTLERPEGWEPTAETAISLETWIETRKRCKHDSLKAHLLWQCSSECFLRWMNHPLEKCTPPYQRNYHEPGNPFFEKAVDKAMGFDLILDIDRFHDPDYIKGLETQYFGTPGMFQGKVPMWCDEESKAANLAYPMPSVSNATLQKIHELNLGDHKFHALLTDCSSINTDGKVDFPSDGRTLVSLLQESFAGLGHSNATETIATNLTVA